MSAANGCLEEARACARQTFALLPVLRRFVTTRVHEAGADLGLSLRQFAALRGIREGATSPGDLARLWQVTPAVITGIVDRLERRGLVRREPDTEDRRRLRLVLTEAGLRASDHVEWALTGDLAAQLGGASRHELAELERALGLLQRAFAAAEEQAPGRAPLSPGDDMPIWDEAADEERPRTEPAMPRTRRPVAAGAVEASQSI